jgi:predicted nuclease of predicted toxin-antitoxin system
MERTKNLFAIDDEIIIEKASKERKIILTHDNDFGKIIYTQKVKFYSIIHLRPGHYNSAYHIATLEKILNYSDKIREGSIGGIKRYG